MRAPPYGGARGEARSVRSVPEERGAAGGQVLIEVLLILPVFMLLIFMIMQIGFFSFQAIITHHGAYEVARVASLSAIKNSPCWKVDQDVVRDTTNKMFQDAHSDAVEKNTLPDPQEGGMHCDVEVTMKRKVLIHLPMIGRFMKAASPATCDAEGCTIVAVVRMPIERPLEK
ncbi:MAG: TadE family protein [Elusimicrobiota bacterium]